MSYSSNFQPTRDSNTVNIGGVTYSNYGMRVVSGVASPIGTGPIKGPIRYEQLKAIGFGFIVFSATIFAFPQDEMKDTSWQEYIQQDVDSLMVFAAKNLNDMKLVEAGENAQSYINSRIGSQYSLSKDMSIKNIRGRLKKHYMVYLVCHNNGRHIKLETVKQDLKSTQELTNPQTVTSNIPLSQIVEEDSISSKFVSIFSIDYMNLQKSDSMVFVEQLAELYNSYFNNPRTEEEWNDLLSLFVKALIWSSAAIGSGVLGNLAYDVLKKGFEKLTNQSLLNRKRRWQVIKRDFLSILTVVIAAARLDRPLSLEQTMVSTDINNRHLILLWFKILGASHIHAGENACSFRFFYVEKLVK